MSTRKPHNMYARLERNCRALVRTNHAAVINIDPAGAQHLVNWKTGTLIKSRPMVDAVCDFAHPWCIYISALCIDQLGQRYIKSIEAAPQGVYLAGQLTEVIEACYRQHLSDCNPQHIVGSGWIAIPNSVTLDEAQAARLFDAVGAWPAPAAA
ncbi:hypothetical protein [Pseudomonas anguilliseptica]|uniref:Uncharacterized protein n=1 Tax=Pseudomonas anguilliseptica TaxID=53406 RepID=A0A1H4UVC8_PSEAG|nr:hypothetical protein [Pseudomonas anguilliseptica]SEC72114.1 hypothetical protein SAMN05421553_1332 [Pseudomonas anguilliseptica]